MNTVIPAYRIFPLGDTAVTIDFGPTIDTAINRWVIVLFNEFTERPFPGMIEAVPAYSSVTIYYDLLLIRRSTPSSGVYEQVKKWMEERLEGLVLPADAAGRKIEIPVCYDLAFAPDLPALAATKQLSIEEVVHLHTGREYQVYMLGFLPGFCYLGDLAETIAMPRKPQPVPVAAGSVGIAGRQTGIYPLASPGGWQIIGRTPVKMFNPAADTPTLVKQGDRVQFISISKNEFENY